MVILGNREWQWAKGYMGSRRRKVFGGVMEGAGVKGGCSGKVITTHLLENITRICNPAYVDLENSILEESNNNEMFACIAK